MSQVFDDTGPLEPHVVSRLGLFARSVGAADSDALEGELEIRPDLTSGGGVPLLGAVGSFADTIGGVVAAISTWPTAIATADIGVMLDPRARPARIVTRPRVVRGGRTNVVTEMILADGDTGATVGYSTMTSAVLSAKIPQQHDPRVVTQMFRAAYEPSAARFYDELGLVAGAGIGDDGAPGARLELRRWLGNSMGMLHGGCTVMVTDAASLAAATAVLGSDRPLATVDTHVRYLNGARIGPVIATAMVLGRDDSSVSVQVTQRDAGWGDAGSGRVTAISTARVLAVG